MSYPGEVPQGGISTDRAIQLIAEAREHDDFLYRTLFGNKSLPHVVYQLEHFKISIYQMSNKEPLSTNMLCYGHFGYPNTSLFMSQLLECSASCVIHSQVRTPSTCRQLKRKQYFAVELRHPQQL